MRDRVGLWMRLGAKASLLVCASLLASCGGGGTGSGGDDGGGSATFSIASSTVSAVVHPGDNLPATREVRLSVAGAPAQGVFVNVEGTQVGVANAGILQLDARTALLQILFRPGSTMPVGVTQDQLRVHVCYDTTCERPLPGSPVSLTATLTVDDSTRVALDPATGGEALDVSVSSLAAEALTVSRTVKVTGPFPASIVVVRALQIEGKLVTYQATVTGADEIRVDFHFAPPVRRDPGEQLGSLQLGLCYDADCHRMVQGGPLNFTIRHTVLADAKSEPGLDPLPVAERRGLAHDVVHAEYSRALDAVVMVSSWPRDALIVRDATSGAQRELALARPGNALSLSPDGLRAAVGHESGITVADLATLGQAGAAPPALLNHTSAGGDIVFDGRGRVHVFPARDPMAVVHTLDIGSGVEALATSGGFFARSRARIHPGASAVYVATYLSPSDVQRFDIAGATAELAGESPYHGELPICDPLWLSEDGRRIVTGCGATLHAAPGEAGDMRHAGTMTLVEGTYSRDRIVWASHSMARRELALLEQPYLECEPDGYYQMAAACMSRLSLHDADTLARTQLYAMPPVTVGGGHYKQLGLWVFHRADGARLVIGRLAGQVDPSARYHLSVVP